MGARRIALSDARSRVLNKEPLFDHIIYKNMALFISSCWFYFARFVFFLVRFTARRVFRIKMEEGSEEVIEDYSVSLEPVSEPNEMEGRDFNGFGEEEEEEEHSSFSFKFEYQIPKISTITNKEGEVPITEENYQTKTTNISNYRVVSERDFSGFVEEPESVTIRVLESFVDRCEEKIDSKPLSGKNFEGFVKKPEPATFQAHESFADGSEEKKIEGELLADDDFGRLVKNPEAVPFQAHESFADIGEEKLEAKFLPERDFIGFGEQPEAKVFQVHESFANSSEKKMESEILSDEDYSPFVEDPEAMSARVQAYFSDSCEETLEPEPFVGSDEENFESGFLSSEEFKKFSIQSPVVMFLKDQKLEGKRSNEKEAISNFSGFDSDSDSISFSDGYSVKDLEVDSENDGFLSERDFGDKESSLVSSTFEMELRENMEKIEEGQFSSQTNYRNIYDGFISDKGFNELERISEEKLHENYSPYTDKLSQLDEVWSENESLDPELELKELNTGKIGDAPSPQFSVQMEFMDSSDDELSYSRKDSNKFDSSEFGHKDLNLEGESNSYNFDRLNANGGSNEGSEKRTEEENSDGTKMKDLDYDDFDELESLWEHQDLIEQLRMELKRVRAIGLPTIPEESESPKTMEDLKPWKFDEKFMKEDPLNEMHKFYKSYRERMRKLDILNYQKMYAIGFLQLKNPLESLGASKPLIPTIISHVSQNLRHRRKSITDPSEKFLKELQVDLETVYVGQTCLSWEFLHWQFEKARERRDSDPYRSHRYNQVAGEFQQFQVTVQRFVENESFQGPRLQNYVKNRCVLRNLLEVPVVREDRLKDRTEERKKGNYAATRETLEDVRDKMEEMEKAITSEKLEDIMEECIRVFWEFVKADKDETPTILKGLLRNHAELQDPSDFKLLSEIQASLQRKDKKLKDILKTGNCLVKKFKKPREDRSNQDLFFSQVDMKLISRVLKMSRITTDQLVWCHMKLSKITFADRKIHREQSFLLFPC
ncbi:uncharacterized protein A4U43_C03F400 [Asparagus officinalis]|uniref:Ribosomal protein L34Ae n=1 Tax=Asparagus officinalis TaxID=4686 RepID=A0A5P1F681_ASPOF|nr:uncharacterized protein LOC109832574 [Asparagus officinalis]XP_020255509.1 uncharacterized protein LOC109832574 [Asparagus officinalis]ONK73868.1 uncharacterized protein A4U43_C03F400 [Asparagus officinalis]